VGGSVEVCALILKSSYAPAAAGVAVRARSAAVCSAVMGWNVLIASSAWSRMSMRSMPVITTDTGRLIV
jgi:hypothetical protein